MGLLSKLLGSKSENEVTADDILAEIARAEGEINGLRTKLGGALAGVAAMSDAEHVKVEGEIAGIERAITRLEARVAYLNTELPTVIAAEESAAKIAADDALRKRAEAARKANTKEAAAILRDYENHVAKISDALTRLDEISTETNAVNQALGLNPVAEHVQSYDDVHRRYPGREATEIREVRPVWRYPSGTVIPAVEDGTGGYKRADPLWMHHEQRYETPVLTREEVVVSRTPFRPGHYELGLNAIVLPPGFAGGNARWPRKS